MNLKQVAIAASLWPTISVGDAESGQKNHSFNAQRGGGDSRLRVTAALWQTPAKDQFSKRRQVGQTERTELLLPAQAEQWATPRALSFDKSHQPGSDSALGPQARAWATPAARDWKAETPEIRTGHEPQFSRQVLQTARRGSESSQPTRRLNPRFVEWLMGLPLGLTAFEPLEMA